MSGASQPWSRRALLEGCAACAVVAVACGQRAVPLPSKAEGGGPGPEGAATDDAAPDSAAPDSGSGEDCAEAGVDTTGWIEIPLAEHPALAVVGGASVLSRPDALLEVILVHTAPGCYAAVWRICTHGACILSWVHAVEAAVCPCHGSQFRADGSLQQGPATVPVRAFRVLRRGDLLLLER